MLNCLITERQRYITCNLKRDHLGFLCNRGKDVFIFDLYAAIDFQEDSLSMVDLFYW